MATTKFDNKMAETAATLTALVNVVEELRKLDPKMELGQLLVYLLIAKNPGMKVRDLLALTGLSSSSISRNIAALSTETYRNGDDGQPLSGHDLVRQVADPFDGRAKLVITTRRGQIIASKLCDMVMPNTDFRGSPLQIKS